MRSGSYSWWDRWKGGKVRAARPREGLVEADFNKLAGKWEEIVLQEPVGD